MNFYDFLYESLHAFIYEFLYELLNEILHISEKNVDSLDIDKNVFVFVK